MIKLEDLILSSRSTITVMDGTFEVIGMDTYRIDTSYLSKKLLDREIDQMDSNNGRIRVWLKEEGK